MPLQAISLTHRKKGFRGFCDFRCFGNLTDQSNRAQHASLVEELKNRRLIGKVNNVP